MATDDDRETQDVLLVALGEGLSQRRAAAAAGVSLATVTRRLRDPAYRQRVMEAREANAEEAASALEGLALRAAERLSSLVDADSEIVALKASALVLDRAEQRRQARAFSDRLVRLEELVAEVLDGQRRTLRGVA